MKRIYACRPASPELQRGEQAGFASIVILLGIAAIIFIGAVVVYQKVLAPKTLPTPTPTLTTTPSSISQLSPTSDPTVGWKTYTNPTYKFSLQYPQNFFFEDIEYVSQPSGKGLTIGYLKENQYKDTNFDVPFITIGIEKTNFSPESWVTQVFRPDPAPQDLKPENYELIRFETKIAGKKYISVDGISALCVNSSYINKNTNKVISQVDTFFQAPQKNFLVNVSLYKLELGSNENKIYDQILSTFKFLD